MSRQDADLAGFFVISKAGHDAGECYVIVSAAGNDFMLANGKNRSLQTPKKKNAKHIFITKQAVPDIELLIKGEPVSSNLKLAGYIKNFSKESG